MNTTRPTLAELMHSVGSSRWPSRWEDIYEGVMEDYETRGCPLTDPDYYDVLDEKYDMFAEFKEDYKSAAAELAEDDNLCRVLALICASMKDRKNISADIASLELPRSPDGSYHKKYEMLTALAMCCMADYTYSLLSERPIPEEHIRYGMRLCEEMVRTYKARNEGRAGAMSWDWYQLAIDAKLYRICRLDIELDVGFTPFATVLRSKDGQNIALAEGAAFDRYGYMLGSAGHTDGEGAVCASIEETDDSYIGYPYGRYGAISPEKVKLSKKEWKKIIEPHDYVVGLHIPPHYPMTDDLIDKSFKEAKEFMAKYYPEVDYKGFVCASWLMDDQLCDLLGEDKNIPKFCKRFSKIAMKSAGRSVFSFVFLKPDVNNVNYDQLEEDTTLKRILKRHFLDGKHIYECYGYIPREDI